MHSFVCSSAAVLFAGPGQQRAQPTQGQSLPAGPPPPFQQQLSKQFLSCVCVCDLFSFSVFRANPVHSFVFSSTAVLFSGGQQRAQPTQGQSLPAGPPPPFQQQLSKPFLSCVCVCDLFSFSVFRANPVHSFVFSSAAVLFAGPGQHRAQPTQSLPAGLPPPFLQQLSGGTPDPRFTRRPSVADFLSAVVPPLATQSMYIYILYRYRYRYRYRCSVADFLSAVVPPLATQTG